MALSSKQKLFVNAYLETFNSTEAARRAEYKGEDATLASVGWENLRKPEIAQAIAERLQEKAMAADEVLLRLAEHARGEHSNYLITSYRLDIGRMAMDDKLDLLPDKGVDDKANVDILLLAKTGRLAAIADYLIVPGGFDLAAMERDGKKHLVKTTKNTRWGKDIEFYDAQAALTLIGKHLDLFNDKLQIQLEKELKQALDALEKSVDSDTYTKILAVLAGKIGSAATGTIEEERAT